MVFHSCVFLALEPVSCSQSHQMQRTGTVATLLGTSPYVWTPSRRLGQGQASSIGSELEVCKTVGKTKKTKKTKDFNQIQGLEGGPCWIWLKSLVFFGFFGFFDGFAYVQSGPIPVQAFPACFLVFLVGWHRCRLSHGLAGASESGLPVLRGIIDIRTPHIGEQVVEVV